jgi:DNA processing protein
MNVEFAMVPPSDPKYPDALRGILGDATLYTIGNLGLLGQRAIGICGSRSASSEAHKWAFKFGEEAAKRGLVVVSGYARGVDREAHKGALLAGGNTIAAIPEGVKYFRIIQELEPLVRLNENFLVVSMFEPDAVWKSWRAMERNKLIVGLSAGLFVVEARETGGTIDAAMECVRQKKPLWAVAYSTQLPERRGNQLLLQDSAIPLTRLSDVRRALENAALKSEEEIRQLALHLA